jgi:hypothetical protein
MYSLVHVTVEVSLPTRNHHRCCHRIGDRHHLLYPQYFEYILSGSCILRAEKARSVRQWCRSGSLGNRNGSCSRRARRICRDRHGEDATRLVTISAGDGRASRVGERWDGGGLGADGGRGRWCTSDGRAGCGT